MKTAYVNHETGEVYNNLNDAVAAYNSGIRIDLYRWAESRENWEFKLYWD